MDIQDLFIPQKELKNENVQLGRGSFGDVVAGTYNGEPVAIKKVRASDLSIFKKEVVILSNLRHPNIVRFWGYSEAIDEWNEPVLTIIMERMETTLLQRITRDPKPTVNQRAVFLLQTAKALAYLHSKKVPIVHKDLKPDNILIGKNSVARLTDFGLSRSQQGARQYDYGNRQRNGQYFFIPPEAYDDKYNSHSSYDVYSFAMTAYFVFSERIPFHNNPNPTPDNVRKWVLGTRRPTRPKDDIIPDVWWSLIEDCWKQAPAERLSSVAVVERIESFINSEIDEIEPVIDAPPPYVNTHGPVTLLSKAFDHQYPLDIQVLNFAENDPHKFKVNEETQVWELIEMIAKDENADPQKIFLFHRERIRRKGSGNSKERRIVLPNNTLLKPKLATVDYPSHRPIFDYASFFEIYVHEEGAAFPVKLRISVLTLAELKFQIENTIQNLEGTRYTLLGASFNDDTRSPLLNDNEVKEFIIKGYDFYIRRPSNKIDSESSNTHTSLSNSTADSSPILPIPPDSSPALYDWLKPSDSAVNMEYYVSEFVDGTRCWALDQIWDWALDSDESQIMWLHGCVGTGKSFISYA
ncbi:UNVERIFIED_CONTAM: hypothetical protein HDU68_011833 [Siphonaria sp. JEL0065]|nr:hypothetical protein HDU68_011833 [Siphonaria sp. JEL0065]